jgi:hypothetical protein
MDPNCVYETLSPWAEADPVSPRGLSAERPVDPGREDHRAVSHLETGFPPYP